MTEIAAITLDQMDGFLISDDRKHVIVKCRSQGDEIHIAYPMESMASFIALMIAANQQSQPRGKMTASDKVVVLTDWWELSPIEHGACLLGLRHPAGGWIDFHLDHQMVSGMREYLNTLTGKPMPPTRKNS